MRSFRRGLVKLYPTPPGWTVSWVASDGRKRKWFGVLKGDNGAEQFAKNKAEQLQSGFTSTITAEQMASVLRAGQLLGPLGLTIEVAAAKIVEWTALLKCASIDEAVRSFVARRVTVSVPIVEAVAEFLKAKRQDKVGGEQMRTLKSRLDRFAAENPGSMDRLTPEHLDRWVRELRKLHWTHLPGGGARMVVGGPIGPQTRNHYRAAILNLLNFSMQPGRRWLSFPVSEFAAFAPVCVERGEVGIFTPPEAKTLLISSSERLLPALAFGFFSGLRPSEVERLKWDDVDLDAGHVFVRGKVRTARYRIAPITPNGVQWLRLCDRGRPVCDLDHCGKSSRDLALCRGMRWIHDGPRHSFVSYRLAVLGDLGKVSEETGTSKETLRKHYRRPIPRSIADEFFAVVP